MNWLYLAAKVSKQGHLKAVKRLEEERSREPCYVGLIETVRSRFENGPTAKRYQ